MLDGLPSGFPGRHSSGSWLGLLFAAVFAAACAFGLYRFLTYAAEYGMG